MGKYFLLKVYDTPILAKTTEVVKKSNIKFINRDGERDEENTPSVFTIKFDKYIRLLTKNPTRGVSVEEGVIISDDEKFNSISIIATESEKNRFFLEFQDDSDAELWVELRRGDFDNERK